MQNSKEECKRDPLLNSLKNFTHQWDKSAFLLTPTWCCSCSEYIAYNVYSCKSCISKVHEGCLEEYNKKINCKGNGIHVFVKKKIHIPVSCEFCEKVITGISGGEAKICIFCSKVVHEDVCESQLPKLCSENWQQKSGPYRCEVCIAEKCQFGKIKNQVIEIIAESDAVDVTDIPDNIVEEKVEAELIKKANEILKIEKGNVAPSLSPRSTPLKETRNNNNNNNNEDTNPATSTAISVQDSTSNIPPKSLMSRLFFFLPSYQNTDTTTPTPTPTTTTTIATTSATTSSTPLLTTITEKPTSNSDSNTENKNDINDEDTKLKEVLSSIIDTTHNTDTNNNSSNNASENVNNNNSNNNIEKRKSNSSNSSSLRSTSEIMKEPIINNTKILHIIEESKENPQVAEIINDNFVKLENNLDTHEDPVIPCSNPVRCTCKCNVGSFHDIMQKSAAIGLGLGLVTGAIVASVLTMGVGSPLIVASVAVTSGIVGGIGTSSAFHGTASAIKKEKINGRDYALDVGIGAMTGAVSGGIGLGFSAATSAASTAALVGTNEAANLGVHGAMKIGSGVTSGVAGKLLSDGVEVGVGRKDKADFGKDLSLIAVTGGLGGVISLGGDQLSKVTSNEMQQVGAHAQRTVQVLLEGGKNVVQDTAKYHTRSALGMTKDDRHEDVVFGSINEKMSNLASAIVPTNSENSLGNTITNTNNNNNKSNTSNNNNNNNNNKNNTNNTNNDCNITSTIGVTDADNAKSTADSINNDKDSNTSTDSTANSTSITENNNETNNANTDKINDKEEEK